MRVIDQSDFKSLLTQAGVKRKLAGELRFNAVAENMQESDWQETEMLSVPTRSPNKGVLLIEVDKYLHVLPYELTKMSADRATGVPKPIICDLCRTWRSGDSAARIGFTTGEPKTVFFLCCADLACSKHVRGKTQAAVLSRAQLHEDLTDEQRLERHKALLKKLIDNVGANQ